MAEYKGETYNLAIVLSGGRGSRMSSDIPKQYLKLGDETVLSHTLHAFEQCSFIDEIIVVAADEYLEYCKREIVDAYGIKKVSLVTAGGKERYDSVCCGLKAFQDRRCQYERVNVFIHDGARPLLTQAVLERCLEGVNKYNACAAGVPVKDTIKVCSLDGKVEKTPDRNTLWAVQTPQVFEYDLILKGHEQLQRESVPGITDDAMIAEQILKHEVYMVTGDYRNLKITTPEDLILAEALLKVI